MARVVRECHVCVREATSDDGLCDQCRSFNRLQTAKSELLKYMSPVFLERLEEYFTAKTENERFHS